MEKRTMDLKINNTTWRIEEVSEAEMDNEMRNDYTLGVTIYREQKIMLLSNQPNMKKTLIHELLHVWLYENGHNAQERQFNHEDVCEIMASCYDFINEIVNSYFQGVSK